jgi:integrase
LTHEFARVVKRAGVTHCTLHDMRRSFSTLAQRAGVDKYTVKDLGGWSVVSVVEKHYTGDLLDVQRKAMQKIAMTA